MKIETFWALYFLIGLSYTLINGIIRKLDTDGDWLLPMVWLFMWPIAFIGIAIQIMQKFSEKAFENRAEQ